MFQTLLQNVGNSYTSWDVLSLAAKSTLMLVITSMACWLLRRNSAAIRHRIWTLGIVSTLLLPLVPPGATIFHCSLAASRGRFYS
jgi:hypothetical protein